MTALIYLRAFLVTGWLFLKDTKPAERYEKAVFVLTAPQQSIPKAKTDTMAGLFRKSEKR